MGGANNFVTYKVLFRHEEWAMLLSSSFFSFLASLEFSCETACVCLSHAIYFQPQKYRFPILVQPSSLKFSAERFVHG